MVRTCDPASSNEYGDRISTSHADHRGNPFGILQTRSIPSCVFRNSFGIEFLYQDRFHFLFTVLSRHPNFTFQPPPSPLLHKEGELVDGIPPPYEGGG